MITLKYTKSTLTSSVSKPGDFSDVCFFYSYSYNKSIRCSWSEQHETSQCYYLSLRRCNQQFVEDMFKISTWQHLKTTRLLLFILLSCTQTLSHISTIFKPRKISRFTQDNVGFTDSCRYNFHMRGGGTAAISLRID